MIHTLDLNAMYAALEKRPADHVTLLALADWHEERGGVAAAECLRWVVIEGKAPFRYSGDDESLMHHHNTWHEGWYWWATSRERRGWGYPPSGVLPHRVWKRLGHSFAYDPLVFKEYPSVRAAIEALIDGWQKPAPRPRRPQKG
jgi:hypothetical protein